MGSIARLKKKKQVLRLDKGRRPEQRTRFRAESGLYMEGWPLNNVLTRRGGGGKNTSLGSSREKSSKETVNSSFKRRRGGLRPDERIVDSIRVKTVENEIFGGNKPTDPYQQGRARMGGSGNLDRNKREAPIRILSSGCKKEEKNKVAMPPLAPSTIAVQRLKK